MLRRVIRTNRAILLMFG